MAEDSANKPNHMTDGLSIFKDVFRRADKNDDGALSMSEFKTFFNDGILSTEDLEKLFNEIDTHNTANIDTQELCDYYQNHLGPFSPIFSGLEKMNSAVSNALLKTSKNYPSATFYDKFTTRFLMKEVVNQLGSLQYHVDTALEKIDEDEHSKRTAPPFVEQKGNATKTKTRKKLQKFHSQISNEGSSVAQLSSQVDRLANLVKKLESKVKFNIIEEEVDPRNDETVTIVRRKFFVDVDREDEFRKSLKTYINESGRAEGCMELSIRVYTDSNVYVLYEIWSSKADFNRHYTSAESKAFLRSNVDCLQQPEEHSQMPIPAVWLDQTETSS